MGRRFWQSLRLRMFVVMVILGITAFYVSTGYSGILMSKNDVMRPTMLSFKQTIETIEVIETNLRYKATIERNIFNSNPNEVFIKHDINGGTHDFVFDQQTTPLSLHDRARLSSITLGTATTSAPPRRRGIPSSNGASKGSAKSKNALSTTSMGSRKTTVFTNAPRRIQPQKVWRLDPKLVTDAHVDEYEFKRDTFVKPTGDIVPKVKVIDANCAKLFRNDYEELKRAKKFQNQNQKVPVPDEEYTKLTKNCEQFKKERQYILQPISIEEAEFPIAYSLVVFKDVEQIERLLRAIYRPQNYYCIHVDAKSDQKVRDAIHSLAQCFDNVFMSSRVIDVQWGWFSVVEPELICMKDLLKYKKWRYFINLTGQEWPLKTNEDIVKVLKVFNGTNSIEGTIKRRNPERTRYIFQGYSDSNIRKRKPPPKGIVLSKGSVHVTASRGYVEYLLYSPVAKEFTEWVKDTGVPDETLFSSLNHSPDLGVPGAYTGDPETDPVKYPFITRFKNWGTYPFNYPCKGERVRMVCIWSVGDLPSLYSRAELFTNKFYLDREPLALDCLEELHYNRTRDEVEGKRQFNTLYYQQLGFVKHHR